MMRATKALPLAAMLVVTGCDGLTKSEPINATTVEGKVRSRRAGGEEVRVWRDPETGCQYLLWERRQRGSMTPRLNAEGKPICRS